MNQNELLRRWPNASRSVQELNAAHSGPSAALECDSGHVSLEAGQVQEGTAGRIHVRITSRRKKLSDPDGLCEKYLLDCVRYCGWIADDSAAHITLETRQEKLPKIETEEETILEIFYP